MSGSVAEYQIHGRLTDSLEEQLKIAQAHPHMAGIAKRIQLYKEGKITAEEYAELRTREAEEALRRRLRK